ncbi:MAG: NrsF family protein [Afipia sp.]
MKTDDLISTLASDSQWRARPVGVWFVAALIAALPVSMWMFMMSLGFRKDAMTAMHNPFFDLKFVVTIALASAAIAISLHLSRPEVSLGRWGWMLAIPLGLLGIGIAGDLAVHGRADWSERLIGKNSMVCMTAIPFLSVPFLIASLVTLRRGAPSRPAVAGAFAGLLSAGLAATLYASHCTDDSPLFVATWYTIAALVTAAVGAAIGARVLKY